MKRNRILAAIVLVVILSGSLLGTACAGAKGEQGQAGVGIQGITNNGNGTSYTTDNLTGPQGPKGETGATGAAGVTGQQGAKGDTGLAGAGVNWKGEWSSSTVYSQNDAVGYQGSSYISRQNGNTNQDPTDTAWWDLWIAKGDQGIQGIQGLQGTQGIQGIQGVQGPPGPNTVVAMLILQANPFDILWNYNVQMINMYPDNHYAIEVYGISYHFANYVAVVTLIGSGPGRTVKTDSANAQLLVYIYDSAGNLVKDNFSLVVFDPSKA